MSNATQSRLAAVPLLAGLSTEELAVLDRSLRTVSLKEGETLFHQGDPGDALYIIESGQLKVCTHGTDNQEIVLNIMGTGDRFGELALLDGQPRVATIVALTDCELLALDRAPFIGYVWQRPEMAIRMLAHVSNQLRQRVVMHETLDTRDSVSRLAQVVLFLAERDGSVEPGVVTSTLNKKQMAEAIGTSEEWVTRMLAEWSQEGIIGMTGPRRLILHDVEALKRLTQHEG